MSSHAYFLALCGVTHARCGDWVASLCGLRPVRSSSLHTSNSRSLRNCRYSYVLNDALRRFSLSWVMIRIRSSSMALRRIRLAASTVRLRLAAYLSGQSAMTGSGIPYSVKLESCPGSNKGRLFPGKSRGRAGSVGQHYSGRQRAKKILLLTIDGNPSNASEPNETQKDYSGFHRWRMTSVEMTTYHTGFVTSIGWNVTVLLVLRSRLQLRRSLSAELSNNLVTLSSCLIHSVSPICMYGFAGTRMKQISPCIYGCP